MQKNSYDITISLIINSLLLFVLIGFIVSIIILYKKRQSQLQKNLEEIKEQQEKVVLNAKLEIQEETFRHISREIHDNINLSLTLAKLNLNTLNINEVDRIPYKIQNSIELLSRSISELSDISQSLNADFIIKNGLLKALQDEIYRIKQIDLFTISFQVEGTPIYMEAQKELLIFRMIQESLKNVIKHSEAKKVDLILNYKENMLQVLIKDDGIGFDPEKKMDRMEAGLNNIKNRLKILNGNLDIKSRPLNGTTINLSIPNNEN